MRRVFFRFAVLCVLLAAVLFGSYLHFAAPAHAAVSPTYGSATIGYACLDRETTPSGQTGCARWSQHLTAIPSAALTAQAPRCLVSEVQKNARGAWGLQVCLQWSGAGTYDGQAITPQNSLGSCSGADIDFYQNAGYGGQEICFSRYDVQHTENFTDYCMLWGWGWLYCAVTWNDQISSLSDGDYSNYGDLYWNINRGAATYWVGYGSSAWYIGNYWNDQASSWYEFYS
jgi:hypothetical protein